MTTIRLKHSASSLTAPLPYLQSKKLVSKSGIRQPRSGTEKTQRSVLA